MAGRADGASGSCFWMTIPFKPDESMKNSPVATGSCIKVKNEQDHYPGSNTDMASLMLGFISQDGDSDQEELNSHIIRRQHCGLRILLVDDSALIRKTTSRSLEKEGYCVQVAQHGAECLKVLAASRAASETGEYGFDLVMMDLQMPVMDGVEATRRIRAQERADWETGAGAGAGGEGGAGGAVARRRIKIVGVTANTEGEAREECMQSGMDGFFEKPVRMTHFHEYLATLGLGSPTEIE